MPLYRSARRATPAPEPIHLSFTVRIKNNPVTGTIWRSQLPGSGVPVFLIEQPDYFERDDPEQGRSLYQYTEADGSLQDYPDNCERFVFFSRALLEAIRAINYWPEVLHLNDWQTGLAAVYLREDYARLEDQGLREQYQRIRTLFTVHNVGYQGLFWHWDMILAGLDWRLFNHHQLEFHGQMSLLKAGLVFADYLNTVSPTYARQIQTPEYGCGLQGLLSERRDRLFGILNGVDDQKWNPTNNPRLPANFSVDAIQPGKSKCKSALQKRMKLPERPGAFLLAVVARLVEQKGINLVCEAVPRLFEDDVQLVVLGDGELRYKRWLRELMEKHPRQMAVQIGYDESLAHQIIAGADAFLMPSQYEPSGLNQLYSMKFGTPSIVRATGGLADTVVDTTPASLIAGEATGFTFEPFEAGAFGDAIRRALELYRDKPDHWLQVMQTGMRRHWSWEKSAAEYERLYAVMVGA